jgi:hypothetical protein
MRKIVTVLVALSIAAATPALAQNKGQDKKHGKDHDNGKAKAASVHKTQGNSAAHKASVQGKSNKSGTVVSAAKTTGGAPSFCRSGAGHPKFGRSWCVQKGFGLGDDRWDRASWSDVVFRTQRSPTLADVLSGVVLGRLTNYAASTLGLRAPLAGTWLINDSGRTVYLVRSGTTPVAELVDTNGDGRADYVLLNR